MAIHQDTFTTETETSSVLVGVKVMQRLFAHLFYTLAAVSLILYYTILNTHRFDGWGGLHMLTCYLRSFSMDCIKH